MSIDPTLHVILQSLPWRQTREVPPGVAADLDDARRIYPSTLYSVSAISHQEDTTLQSPDGLEQLYAEVLEYDVSWGDVSQGGGQARYKCVVLTTYRRPVAHLQFDRAARSFSSSAAIFALFEALKSEGWQEV